MKASQIFGAIGTIIALVLIYILVKEFLKNSKSSSGNETDSNGVRRFSSNQKCVNDFRQGLKAISIIQVPQLPHEVTFQRYIFESNLNKLSNCVS